MDLGPRSSGILLHPTCLPGRLGIGTLGTPAREFLGALAEMRQSWWQMLPVGPTGYGDSPYQSPSTFAGNPLLIDLDGLVEDGLLRRSDIDDPPPVRSDRVDFGSLIGWRMARLRAAGARLGTGSGLADTFETFCDRHGESWLDDFALFTAIKRAHGMRPWWEWDDALGHRSPDALEEAERALADDIHAIRVEQFLFERQFSAMRDAARALGVGLIGDLPIFVAHDSADVWANRELFLLDASGQPTVVAGVPPDYFSETGQLWGNPLYDWDRHVETGFDWWTRRLGAMLERFDLVRIDHFRGFEAYWEIPAGRETAVEGRWVEAPGVLLFDHLRERFGELPVIAEDLGVITDEVEELRDRYGFPGMKVLQFGFGTESAHAPTEIGEQVIAYTGTHDNDTALGWYEDPDPTRVPERRTARAYLGQGPFHWLLIQAVFRSPARIAIVPLQDVLGLGSEARMNTPGTDSGNWTWRFEWFRLDRATRSRLRTLTIETGRARKEER